jgi:hypothetical protein
VIEFVPVITARFGQRSTIVPLTGSPNLSAAKGRKRVEMFLNIDKPRRSATLHSAGCPFLPKPLGTALKHVDELGRDGGWFAVSSEGQARAVWQKEFPRGEFVRCQNC